MLTEELPSPVGRTTRFQSDAGSACHIGTITRSVHWSWCLTLGTRPTEQPSDRDDLFCMALGILEEVIDSQKCCGYLVKEMGSSNLLTHTGTAEIL